jgi:hypothetical protein
MQGINQNTTSHLIILQRNINRLREQIAKDPPNQEFIDPKLIDQDQDFILIKRSLQSSIDG